MRRALTSGVLRWLGGSGRLVGIAWVRSGFLARCQGQGLAACGARLNAGRAAQLGELGVAAVDP